MNKPTVYKKIGPYQLIKEIGTGSFARVYLAKSELSDQQYAVKMISKNHVSEENLAMIDKEIEILLSLNHPNIIKLMDYKKTRNNWYLIFEFCEAGDLEKYMKNQFNGQFPEKLAQGVIQQISKGIKEMHSQNIVHRDLKLANILVNKDFIVKLGDFGFAKYIGQNIFLQSYCGTPITMAIEILKREKYTEKCDMWSLGVIIYQMLFGVPPFNPKMGGNINDLIAQIEEHDIKYPVDVQISEEVKDLIEKTLVVDQDKRISFEDYFNHPWILGTKFGQKQQQNLSQSDSSDQQYQNLLKSAYTNKSSKNSSNNASQQNTENKSVKQNRPISPKMFMHSSVEDEKSVLTEESINEYLGMTINQKIKQNFEKYMKYFQEFQGYIQQIKEVSKQTNNNQSIKKLIFIASIYLFKKSLSIITEEVQLNIQGQKQEKLTLPFRNDFKQLFNEVSQPLKQNIQQQPDNIEDLKSGSTRDVLYKYLCIVSKLALENEFENEKDKNLKLFCALAGILKLIMVKKENNHYVCNIYDIKVTQQGMSDEIISKINIVILKQFFQLTDEQISQGTFSRKLFDMFEFESKNIHELEQKQSELHNSEAISQKDMDQHEKYLKQRIQKIKGKQQEEQRENKNINRRIRKFKEYLDPQDNKKEDEEDTYDETGFDNNYKMQ